MAPSQSFLNVQARATDAIHAQVNTFPYPSMKCISHAWIKKTRIKHELPQPVRGLQKKDFLIHEHA